MAEDTRVVCECVYGMPLVVDAPCSTLMETPTLYWLTCPKLRSCVGMLEGQGYTRLINLRLGKDDTMRAQLENRCRQIVETRRSMAGRSPEGVPESLLCSGIDGGRDPMYIKCLHAHLADYMAGHDNPIGAMVAGSVGEIKCSDKCSDI